MMVHGAPLCEVTYDAVILPGQIFPRYDKGYLIFLELTNHLQVLRPDGSRAVDMQLQCPGAPCCSTLTAAVDSRGRIAVMIGYMGAQDRVSGIRILDPQGKEVRFLDTSPYVPMMLAFDETMISGASDGSGTLRTTGANRNRITSWP